MMRYVIMLTVLFGISSDAISTHLVIASGAGRELNPNFSGDFWILNLAFFVVLAPVLMIVFPRGRCAESIKGMSVAALVRAASRLSLIHYFREEGGRCVLAFFVVAPFGLLAFRELSPQSTTASYT